MQRLAEGLTALVRAIEATDPDGDAHVRFHFEPYTYCLAVTVTLPAGEGGARPSSLGPDSLPAEVLGVDKVLWHEEGRHASVRLTEYARDKERPNELYFLNLRPVLDAHAHVSERPDGSGIVTRDRGDIVMQIPAMGIAALAAIDGKTPLRDVYRLLVARFGLFRPEQLGGLMEQLQRADIVSFGQRLFPEKTAPAWRRRIARLMSLDFPLPNAAAFMARLDGLVGWLFGRNMLWVWTALVVFSLVVFNFDLDDHTHVFESPDQILDQLDILSLILFYLCLGVLTVVHELSHAGACMRNGGRISSFGLMLYFGSIAAYCDTSAAWGFPGKWRRVSVSFAGPMSNIILGCALAWGDVALYRLNLPDAGDFLGALAMVSMLMAMFNLLPLLKLDGYYILSDLSGLPRLEGQAKAIMFRFLRWRRPFSSTPLLARQHAALWGYGILSPLFGMALLGLLAYKVSFDPAFQANRFWFLYGLFMLLATVNQKLVQVGQAWYAHRKPCDIVIK